MGKYILTQYIHIQSKIFIYVLFVQRKITIQACTTVFHASDQEFMKSTNHEFLIRPNSTKSIHALNFIGFSSSTALELKFIGFASSKTELELKCIGICKFN